MDVAAPGADTLESVYGQGGAGLSLDELGYSFLSYPLRRSCSRGPSHFVHNCLGADFLASGRACFSFQIRSDCLGVDWGGFLCLGLYFL